MLVYPTLNYFWTKAEEKSIPQDFSYVQEMNERFLNNINIAMKEDRLIPQDLNQGKQKVDVFEIMTKSSKTNPPFQKQVIAC